KKVRKRGRAHVKFVRYPLRLPSQVLEGGTALVPSFVAIGALQAPEIFVDLGALGDGVILQGQARLALNGGYVAGDDFRGEHWRLWSPLHGPRLRDGARSRSRCWTRSWNL